MKRTLMAAAVVAAMGCFAGSAADAASAVATSGSLRPQSAPATDVSAAQRHYRHHRHVYRGYHYAPRYGYGYGHGYGYAWHPGDPTAGPNSLLSFYRRNNICAIDEGYGRATRCD